VDGGGIYNGGTTTVTGCKITDCEAQRFGGGIYSANYGALTVEYGEINGCTASQGGALSNMGMATIIGTEMAYNVAKLRGGAIFMFGTMVIKDQALIRDNSTVGDGGGIYQS
jgi:autotransporter family porin